MPLDNSLDIDVRRTFGNGDRSSLDPAERSADTSIDPTTCLHAEALVRAQTEMMARVQAEQQLIAEKWRRATARDRVKVIEHWSQKRHAGGRVALALDRVRQLSRRVSRRVSQRTLKVSCSARSALSLWTQFAKAHVGNESKQLDDTQLRRQTQNWAAHERVPDQRIFWRSTFGVDNAGTVRFEPLGIDSARVHLVIEYESERALQQAGDTPDIMRDRLQQTCEDFKKFFDERWVESQSWTRGDHSVPCATDPLPNG